MGKKPKSRPKSAKLKSPVSAREDLFGGDPLPPRGRRGSVPSRGKKIENGIEEVAEGVADQRPVSILSQDLVESLLRGDPNKLLLLNAMYATGDVVALGLMSQEEYDAEAEYNEDGKKVKRSGHELAMVLIPPRLRAKVASDIVPFYFAKKKEREETRNEDQKPIVHYYIPDNGRTKQ